MIKKVEDKSPDRVCCIARDSTTEKEDLS